MKHLFYLAIAALTITACGHKDETQSEQQPHHLEGTWNLLGMKVKAMFMNEGRDEKDTSFFIDNDKFNTEAYLKFKGDSLYSCFPETFTTSYTAITRKFETSNDTIYLLIPRPSDKIDRLRYYIVHNDTIIEFRLNNLQVYEFDFAGYYYFQKNQ
jgi:hypothetical protein